MILENLKDFEWYNEPENVVFADKEMKLSSTVQTDFWQSLHHNFKKDNGHFFYLNKNTDFSCVVHWRAENLANFNQCGIMVRVNEQNWFKASAMYQDKAVPELGSCLTIKGHSDWAGVMLKAEPLDVWYKIVKRNHDFMAFYSLDGKNFIRLRQFYLDTLDCSVKIGAYICSPQDSDFEAILEDIGFN